MENNYFTDNELAALREMCEIAGLTFPLTRKTSAVLGEVFQLEFIFPNLFTLGPVYLFTNLTKLTVVSAEVNSLRGVEALENLHELMVVESKIKSIDHLKSCVKLKKLYLYSNSIQKIKNLHKCRALEVLWLAKNKISVIENLNALTHLKELNLADNLITKIGDSLKNNARLEYLNLSDLPRLKSLSFADHQYASNPVCSFCNYIMCIIYHFKTLQRLDGQKLSESDLKREFEAVRLKKLYYGMQLQMIESNKWEIIHKIENLNKEIQQKLSTKLENILFTMKELERIMSLCHFLDAQMSYTEEQIVTAISEIEGIHFTIEMLDKDLYANKMTIFKAMCEECKARQTGYSILSKKAIAEMIAESDGKVQLLRVELESIGIIKLQHGKPEEQWYQACQDLLLARFCANHYSDVGIVGLKMKAATKIQNESLELLFKQKLVGLTRRNDCLTEISSAGKINYLFLVLKDCDRLSTIAEVINKGCSMLRRPADCHLNDSNDRGIIKLTNSLYHLDRARLTGCSSREVLGKLEEISCHKGSVLIMKSYTGLSVELIPNNCRINENVAGFDMYIRRLSNSNLHKIGPGISSITKSCACDLKCCEYFALDPDLLVPSYLVEFEYIFQTAALSPFLSILRDGTVPIVRPDKLDDEKNYSLSAPIRSHPVQLKWSDITKRMCTNNLTQLEEINLHGLQLINIPVLTPLYHLEKIILSFNCLTNLTSICNLDKLKVLDVSYNFLTTLEGLKGVPNLTRLDLNHNQLSQDSEVVECLVTRTPNLSRLCIQENQWPPGSNIYSELANKLSKLIHQDDKIVHQQDLPAENTFEIDFTFLLPHVTIIRRPPPTLSLENTAKLLANTSQVKTLHPYDSTWPSKVTSLDLTDMKLTKLNDLEKLENLKWACFTNNHLTSLEDIEMCSHLEELNLDFNHITSLNGIGNLKHLTILNVAHNELTTFDECDMKNLQFLECLNANYNNLTDLEGLQNCNNLIQLSAMNNQIDSIISIAKIKYLQHLAILMLLGNPVVSQCADYRYTILYNNPRLLGLDGKPVSSADVDTARSVLGGRLTIEFVRDRVKDQSLSSLVHLDLANLSLQSVNLGHGSDLPNLRSINLEKNMLNSFSGLLQMDYVKVLCLNYNRIESLFAHEFKKDDEQVMKKLEVLHLAYNNICQVESLQLHRFPSLKSLFLQGNKIKSMSGLQGLWYLEHLVLDRNQISVIGKGELEALCWLQELHLQENVIKDLPVLCGPSGLQKLFLGSNRIKDLEELFKLAKLPCLEEVSFVGNSVTRRALHRSILIHFVSTLEVVDGVPVTIEERAKASRYFSDLSKHDDNTEELLTGSADGEIKNMCMLTE